MGTHGDETGQTSPQTEPACSGLVSEGSSTRPSPDSRDLLRALSAPVPIVSLSWEPSRHPVLLEIQTGAPTPCPGTHTLPVFAAPAPSPVCFLLLSSPAAPSWPLWTAPGGACPPAFPGKINIPSDGLFCPAHPGLGWFWPQLGRALPVPVTLSSRFPPQRSSPAPAAPDGLYGRWNLLLREGRRDVPAQRFGGSWESQQTHAGLPVPHTAATPLPPFHQEGAVSREGLSPRGCAPLVLVEGSRSEFAGQVAALAWGISALPAGFMGSAQHPGEEATCPQQLSGLSRAEICGRGAARPALGEQHTLCS